MEKYNIDGVDYYKIKDVYSYLSISDNRNANRLCRNDPILSNYYKVSNVNSNGGVQTTGLFESKYMFLLLSKLNTKLFNDEQRAKFKELLNKSINVDVRILPDNNGIYNSEFGLRDELYNLGYLGNIKIIEKEKIYDFGRIDLYGIDENKKQCCIELKRYGSLPYLKEQLLKYKNSGKFARVIYVSYNSPDNDLMKFLRVNNIEYFKYKRQLVIEKIL